MKTGYIPSLDGIRALAVSLVFFAHAGLGHIIPGGLGVTAFFFLSGFLITTLLVKEYDGKGAIHYPYFFLRRVFRLFPPLLTCLALVYALSFAGVVGGGRSVTGLLAQVFYLANYHQIFEWPGAVPDGLGVLWSLAVEEHFYLFFPLILAWLLKRVSRRHVPRILMVVCALVLGWRGYLVLVEQVSTYRTYYATDTRIDSILFGCILALTINPVHQPADATMKAKDYLWLVASTAVMLVSLLVRDERFRETLRYTVQGLALMPVFYLAVVRAEHPLFSWLNWGWMKKLGVYSYGIYLIHHVIIEALASAPSTSSLPVVMAGSLAASVVFAAVVDRFIDRYFARLRKAYR
jgi:peptidoglycan/LPS O-acetylase OafA/YrhL